MSLESLDLVFFITLPCLAFLNAKKRVLCENWSYIMYVSVCRLTVYSSKQWQKKCSTVIGSTLVLIRLGYTTIKQNNCSLSMINTKDTVVIIHAWSKHY